jgi:hypothetical protein
MVVVPNSTAQVNEPYHYHMQVNRMETTPKPSYTQRGANVVNTFNQARLIVCDYICDVTYLTLTSIEVKALRK